MSGAVGNIVQAIFNEADCFEEFAIETHEQAQIVQYPRGSHELISLLFRNPVT
jgi:hypothetical protein